jgi:sensor c-di-GMP phosphodiesterase-like protein
MKSFKLRVWITLAVTILAAIIGAGGGYLLGGLLALRQAKQQLRQGADRLVAEEDASLTETYATLKKMSSSPYPYCSEAEIAYFRKLLFQTDYLRDGGRMHNGMIDCSVTLSPADLPRAPLKPDYSMPGGSKVYRETAPLQVRDQPTFGVQFNDLYVVINSAVGRRLDSTPLQFIMTVTPAGSRTPARLLSTSPQPDDAVFAAEGLVRKRETLYFTRCTPDKRSCVTTHITIPAAMRTDLTQLRICMALGGLVGALFGFISFQVYRRSRSMEQQLRRAIRRNQLRVVYQPIVSLASGRIVGAEALARWTDEDGCAVGPDVFVKVAEENGFVGSLTRLVARRALHDFSALLRAHPDFHLSINVAASDLTDPGFLPMLEQALQQAGVQARSLTIEITESSTARHEAAIATILRLRQRGHSVHIDDFGTGYSSLSYLHALSVDAIKIDRSFTRSIGTEAVTVVILPQILAMAEALKLQVIVEGIETTQQADYFAAVALPILGQGWLFGRPVPTEEFHRLLAEAEKTPPETDPKL